jgi:hypothetical protein
LDPQVITGGVVSIFVTHWLHVVEFPQQSVICHVRTKVPGQAFGLFVCVLDTVIVTFVPQHASTAVGVSKVHALPHTTVLFVGHVATGGVVSTTVTVWLHGVETLPQQSAACHFLVAMVVHGGTKFVNVPRIVTVTFVPQHASKAVGSSKVHGFPHSTILLVAHVSVGGIVSTIFTTSVQTDVFEQQSDACHVIVSV